MRRDTHTPKTVLWIDDSAAEREAGLVMLNQITGIAGRAAASSNEAREILERYPVDAVVTDILRRNPDGTPSDDDGLDFVQAFVRPRFPEMPVVFHTKNALGKFGLDAHSQYLAKWEAPAKKAIELEVRLAESVTLHETYLDWSTWQQIEPRLVKLQTDILGQLGTADDIWRLTPDQFEQLIGEVLERMGFGVLWIPGGRDGGIDIVATTHDRDFLIDVKRYKSAVPVSVELVRRVYGVAEAVASTRLDRIVYGGIITSSRFTADAEAFRTSLRRRPLMYDGQWLKEQLSAHAPRLRGRVR